MANVIKINGKKVKDIDAVRMASLAPVEASTTATAAHAVGALFWLDGTLYEATAAIAVGGTITVGTNCKVADMNNMPQPDWNQSNSSANGFIKNKPAIRQQANGGGILENGASSASGQNSHAEGGGTTASGAYSHAEGGGTTASGAYSHAEGGGTTASGAYSHSEGGNTIASGDYSHAEGSNTTANHMAQHVFGMHNVPDSSAESSGARGNYIEIVGNGLDTNRRSNARTLDWEGNEEVAGDIIAYGCGGANPISLADLKSQITDVETLQRVSSLNTTHFAKGTSIEAVGIPVYVDDVTDYPQYDLTETGWYIFARVTAKDSVTVSASTVVNGAAGYIAVVGNSYIDLAVKFGVAAMTQEVVINWGSYIDMLVFRANDLAIRNLDYRTTFYVYDIAPFAVWTFAVSEDTTFLATKGYYTKDGDEYVKAEVTTGEPVPAYYVMTGEDTYERVTEGVFAAGTTYYTKDGDAYTPAEVVAGEAVPVYYVHSKIIFEGMTRNVTYRLDKVIDCPMEFVLPPIEDDDYGAWFEVQLRHTGTYSCSLVVPEGVKAATNTVVNVAAGMNLIDLQYASVDGEKVWRAINTHSGI